MKEVFIYDGLRTAFGRHAGALSRVRPDDLVASVIRELMTHNDIPGEAIEDVILGNTNQTGEDSPSLLSGPSSDPPTYRQPEGLFRDLKRNCAGNR